MPDDSRALARPARVLADALKRRSPSAKVAQSFRTIIRGSVARIVSHEPGAWATDNPPQGARHPLFGDRRRWYNTNQRHPERTAWSERAAEEAASKAADAYVDEILREYGFE